MKLKRKINLTDPKKIKIIKIIRIKIEIKNKNKILIEGFNWKEKSIQQKKQKKPIKWMRTNLKKITYPKLGSKDKIEKNNFFIKWQRTKIKNKKK